MTIESEGRSTMMYDDTDHQITVRGVFAVSYRWIVGSSTVYLSIYLSKKSRLGRRKCRDTTRAPNNVNSRVISD